MPPSLPTRKRQGTWEESGSKRHRPQVVATERKRSEVAAEHDIGQAAFDMPGDERAQFHCAPREEAGANLETDAKHCTILA